MPSPWNRISKTLLLLEPEGSDEIMHVGILQRIIVLNDAEIIRLRHRVEFYREVVGLVEPPGGVIVQASLRGNRRASRRSVPMYAPHRPLYRKIGREVYHQQYIAMLQGVIAEQIEEAHGHEQAILALGEDTDNPLNKSRI